MDVSLAKLLQLVTVARLGSISRAAAELNLSQPALSRSIAAIEQRYGFTIFNRLGHGVEPTSAGRQVIEQAEPILQALHVFDSNLRLLGAGKGGTLSMGMAPLLASLLLPRFSAAFFGTDGNPQLRVMIRPGGELLQALKSNAIELFFFPQTHLDTTEDLSIELVGHIEPVCVVRRGHPLAGRTGLSISDLADVPLACSVEQPAGFEVPGTARLVCDNYHILREAVLLTDLVCICATDFVADDLASGSLVEIAVRELPTAPTPIFMAKLKGRSLSPLANEAVNRMAAYIGSGVANRPRAQRRKR